MNDSWDKQLPGEYRYRVAVPITFARYTEPSSNAVKIIGFDAKGAKCFEYHSLVLTEELNNEDELPIQFSLYYEQVIAWRLRHGKWISLKSFSNRADCCQKEFTTLPIEFTEFA